MGRIAQPDGGERPEVSDDGRLGGGLTLLRPPRLPQRDKVDRLQQHGREAAFARDVGKQVSGEWKQDTRTLDQQYRFDRIVRNAAQREDAGIREFGDKYHIRRRHLALAIALTGGRLMRLGTDQQ